MWPVASENKRVVANIISASFQTPASMSVSRSLTGTAKSALSAIEGARTAFRPKTNSRPQSVHSRGNMARRKKAAGDDKPGHEQHNGKPLTELLAERGFMLLCMVSDPELRYWPYAAVNQKTLERAYFRTREEIENFAKGEQSERDREPNPGEGTPGGHSDRVHSN